MVNTVCRSVEFGLRAIGVWPDTSYAILRRAFCISTMAIFQTFQYQHLIMHYGDEDLFLLMDVLSATLAYTLLLIKLIIFSFNARLLNEIIARLVEDWKERDVCDEYAMTRMSYISRRFSNFIIALYALSVLLYATGTLLRYKSNNQNDTRELILKMELPFEIKSTSVHVAVLVTQFIHQTSAASMVGVMNSLLITLVLHVCGQIDTVRQKLSEITRKDIKRDASESIVKMLIIRHQKIISFSKNIEAFFSNIALIQFVSNTLVICCLGFIIVISFGVPDGSSMLIKSVFFYIVISMEAFIFCFLGEYLSTKVSIFHAKYVVYNALKVYCTFQSQKIGDAAYESLWYELNPNQNRDVLIMIIRSQKHLTLTIGKVMDLSLRQFASIVKASASYVSVLHAMY
ncbi:PREDICTED: odorant receptor 13a-like isoform X3 [Vollenhovia emeryi]|uniref:odorant receptor 13a-like isoform X3 n=1 Tax=Vollenhovia emeryi TaxID=411798 RepID=UPI0005F3CDA1|nr:PREDICTED: odorant receptor 13a-like isoform X3 [Vollenhovia emeryi]